jgi:alcohol dehydrogenase class IV
MLRFRHLEGPLRCFAGEDCLRQLGPELQRAGGRRAIVFCGQTVAAREEVIGPVRAALGEAYAGTFDRVASHATLPAVLDGVAAMRDAAADAVVALGGGSTIVTARAAAILAAEGGDARRLATYMGPGGRPVSPVLAALKMPQFVIPTTPTTAAAKAGAAVLDPDTGQRLALFDPKTRAAAIFLHPAALASAPVPLVRTAALNAFAMAVEGVEACACDPFAEAQLLHAITLLHDGLPRLQAQPEDLALRGSLMSAALLAGLGTNHTGAGLDSALAHAVGVHTRGANGLANAVLLVPTMRFNAPACSARLAMLARHLGAPASVDGAVQAVIAFLARLPIPRRLRDLGVAEHELPLIAIEASRDFFWHQNPLPVGGPGDAIDLLRSAW